MEIVKKKLVVGLFVCCFLFGLIPLGFGYTVQLEDSYSLGYGDTVVYDIETLHPSANASVSAYAQNFNVSTGGYLLSVDVKLRKNGYTQPNGTVSAMVVGCGNSISGSPNATVYGTSSTSVQINPMDNVTYVEYEFEFNGTYLMAAGVKYALVIYVNSAVDLSQSQNVLLLCDNTVPSHAGSFWLYHDSGWEEGSGVDMCFELYSSDVSLESSSSGSGTTTDVDETIASLMWWFIYLIVMLAPAWFLGGFLKMGKWGFVVGLAIGAGVGYAFLTGFPLWLLVLVAVGEAGLVYSTVSREA